MGRARAEEMIQYAGFEAALRDHLQNNHYPPVSLVFLPAAKLAIQNMKDAQAHEGREYDQFADMKINLPNNRTLSARRIVEQLHLEAFVEAA